MELQLHAINQYIARLFNYRVNRLSIQLLEIFLGFFISTILSTIPAQTGDWGIIAAAILVTIQEITSKIVYQSQSCSQNKNNTSLAKQIIKCSNNIKIGILYGLFVDAFKLGS
uniref:Uncharacterized protein ycf20 n=1 Tax=Sporolithon durum TaxID=48970 RepID=A0A141SCX0_9FLOR|nr:hypothetical protein Sdur_086 [Sporolithon durum]AMK96138.1 hypothetical protein Sdur_086 [Sporolithon durum]